MNVLIIGSGGREHTLAWKIAQSNLLDKLYIAPGNAGTASLGTNVNIAVDDFNSIVELCLREKIAMVIVGPEDPLVKGITDFFRNNPKTIHIAVIGPGKVGAQLEGSKEFAKEFMKRHQIPTAGYLAVTKENIDEGHIFLENINPPYVLKADGLAAGKGVLILASLQEAQSELTAMLNGKFGEASKKVVIEEFLKGIEMSAFVITDGVSYKILPEAKDYKRVGEGDSGLNTGGMGCVSPVPFATKDFLEKVESQVIKPTIDGLKKDKIPYTGFVFFGLMNYKGNPYVIEYNARLGDPETEVILPRIESDILELFDAAAKKQLDTIEIKIKTDFCATVMLVSGGYPEHYEKGKSIQNLEKVKGSLIFHAGTKLEKENSITNGGRVISVSSLAPTLKEALNSSYKNAEIIDYEGKYYRRDIGFDLQVYL